MIEAERSTTDDGVADEERLPVAFAARYRDVLVRYFLRRGIPADAAEDCAQDVFVRIANADRRLIRNAEAYLFAIAASVVIDRARRQKSHCEDKHEPIDRLSLPSAGLSPARVFEGRQALLQLAAILDELPPRTREIFLLNRLDGLGYTQLAARYGLSVSSIEKQMTKALVHIRKRFQTDD